ncbi:MAG: ATP-dependent helicase [Eubacteriales bacterium]|nr:ATP-dependent helicase [Lachnospiraceae bacterium]MDO5128087.1 ATP-dependent helicase [Eubacteriales bacterium]
MHHGFASAKGSYESFDPTQQTAIRHTEGSMLVVAGPGSGKTTVITERIRHLISSAGVSPADILVITFTRAAANEMEQRFRMITKPESYPVRFGTFHSIFFWIVKTAYNLDNSCIMTEEEKRQLVSDTLQQMSIRFDNKEDVISSVLAQMSLVACDMIDVENYYSYDMPEEDFRVLYKNVSKRKKQLHKIDFDDMLMICYELLTKRSDILNQCRRIFRYIMVDEFQDSNRLQYEILKLLANPSQNLFVVGDDDQSIYGFRGARPEIMKQFCKDFPNCKQVTLGMNYRCAKEIVDAASKLISNNRFRFKKSLCAGGMEQGIVQIVSCKDIDEENRKLIAMIRQHEKQGIPYEKQAVLYRTNQQPRRLIYKLGSFNIPYTISDAVPNLFDHFVVKNLIDYMYVASGDMTRARILRIINKPGRYISRDVFVESEVSFEKIQSRLKPGSAAEDSLLKFVADIGILKKLKPYAAVNFIRKFVGYDAYLKEYAEYRQMDVGELYDILDEFASLVTDMNSFGDVFLFAEEYENFAKNTTKHRHTNQGVQLMTMHSAKGLEFEIVYLIDAVEGVTPYRRAKTPAEIEEERRMFYVAMTRAKHELYMFVPGHIAGKAKDESRFIREIRKSDLINKKDMER